LEADRKKSQHVQLTGALQVDDATSQFHQK